MTTYYYGDEVEVLYGFYKGCQGIIIEHPGQVLGVGDVFIVEIMKVMGNELRITKAEIIDVYLRRRTE